MSTVSDIEMDLTAAEEILNRVRQENGIGINDDDLIPILQEIQDSYGYLPHQILSWVSKETKIPESRMLGVITFYEQFHLEPRGKHIIRCCRGTACHVREGQKIVSAISDILGINGGETTEDLKFTFETVACLGTCALAPVLVIDDKYYGKMTPKKIEKVLGQIDQEGN